MKWLGACLVAMLALTAAPARAQGESLAAQHYRQGQTAFDAHDYGRAATEFEAANQAAPATASLLAAGLSWELAGDLLRGAADLAGAIQGGLQPPDEGKAREHLADIDRKLGHLDLVGPSGERASVDGATEAPLPLQARVTPGDHTLEGRAQGGAIERRNIHVDAGATVRVDLTPESTPPPRAEGARGTTQRTLGWIGVAVGAAAIGAGAIMGGIGLNANNQYNDGGNTDGSLRTKALTFQALANVMFISGGVVGVTGVVLVLTAPHASSAGAQSAGFPGVALRGQF